MRRLTTMNVIARAMPAKSKALTSWEFWGRVLVLPYLW